MLITRRVCRLYIGLMLVGASVASAQDYPSKPIRIVTSAAGGGSDFTARQVAQGISGPLGQPVIVDNRAGGIIAAEVVSKSPPDGYTLTVQGALWIVPLLSKAPYEVSDFAPRSEEHTSELQSQSNLVCRLLLEKK